MPGASPRDSTVPREMRFTVREAEKRGMERVGWTHAGRQEIPKGGGRIPDQVTVPESFDSSASRGEYVTTTGEEFVYMLISSGSGPALVYRQLKSDYYETTPEAGTCPNCQSHVERRERDDYLTCEECGWQYKSLMERLRNLF